jgi:hypothetical protein
MEAIDDEAAPLKRLINHDCFLSWRVYGAINENVQVEVEKIEEMCQDKFEKIKEDSPFFKGK